MEHNFKMLPVTLCMHIELRNYLLQLAFFLLVIWPVVFVMVQWTLLRILLAWISNSTVLLQCLMIQSDCSVFNFNFRTTETLYLLYIVFLLVVMALSYPLPIVLGSLLNCLKKIIVINLVRLGRTQQER